MSTLLPPLLLALAPCARTLNLASVKLLSARQNFVASQTSKQGMCGSSLLRWAKSAVRESDGAIITAYSQVGIAEKAWSSIKALYGGVNVALGVYKGPVRAGSGSPLPIAEMLHDKAHTCAGMPPFEPSNKLMGFTKPNRASISSQPFAKADSRPCCRLVDSSLSIHSPPKLVSGKQVGHWDNEQLPR